MMDSRLIDRRVLSRRSLLRYSATALAASTLPPLLTSCMSMPGGQTVGSHQLKTLGLQLYTLRDAMKADLEGTLSRVAAIGFNEVEFAGYYGRSAIQIRDVVKQNGLSAPGAHVGLGYEPGDWERTVEFAHTVGHRYLVLPGIDVRTVEACRRSAERLNHAGEISAQAGIRLAYHNHDYEFRPIEGGVPLDLLFETIDPKLLFLEIDLGHMVEGGGDPLTYFKRYAGRIKLIHAKDTAGPPDFKMVDVGKGIIDWPAIFSHAREAGIEHVFVENDNPPDPFASITASHKYLRQLRYREAQV